MLSTNFYILCFLFSFHSNSILTYLGISFLTHALVSNMLFYFKAFGVFSDIFLLDLLFIYEFWTKSKNLHLSVALMIVFFLGMSSSDRGIFNSPVFIMNLSTSPCSSNSFFLMI
jgi:hypothetical protein